MKNIKKIFTAAALLSMAAFGFFGCADSEEDEELETVISVSGDSSKTVKMTASSTNAEGHKVFVIYTLDGSEPTAEMISNYDKAKFATDVLAAESANATDEQRQKILEYVDCGTANVIESGKPVTIAESTTITAKAFYIVATDAKPLKTGPKSTQDVTIALTEDQKNTTDSDENKAGNLNFKLTKTGNGFSIHYYDTSAKTFTYTGIEHCYYQFQFTTRANGKGIWYLYIRKLGAAAPIKSENGTTNFMAKGTWTGNAFNATAVTAGNITMKYVNAKTNEESDFATISVSEGNESSFDFTVTADANGKTNITTAIDANDEK